MNRSLEGRRVRDWPVIVALLAAALATMTVRAPVAWASITNGCMEDVAGFNLNCNANDIRLASVTNIVVLDDGCAFPGDTVTFDAVAELELSSQERFDIGIYIATDGGNALNGACFIDTLPEAPDPPFVDLDTAEGQPGDLCGDIDDDHNPISTTISGLTVLCIDNDEDGFLDLPNCLSWRQPGSNDLCTTPLDAFPGSPSKCNCDILNTLEIEVPPGAIMVEKTAFPTQVTEPGGLVTFSVVVSNPSTTTSMTLTSLTDNLHGNLNGQGTCSVPQVIPANGSYACSFSAMVSGAGGTSETDVVTAGGIDTQSNVLSDTDDATVEILDVPSSIQVVKTANPTSVEPGGMVTFSFVVTNTSTVDTVTITSLTDTIYGDLNGMGDCSVPQVLAPSASYACSFVTFIFAPNGTSETNVVTASGTDDDDQPVSDSDDATVTVNDVPSDIELIKTANPTSVQEPGGLVTFTFLINNVSLTDTVTITSLTDTIYGNLNGQGTCSVPQVIPPGGSYSCSFTTTVTGTCNESETNIATASGTDDENMPVSAVDSATVDITDVPSSIDVTKTANPVSVPESGGLVTYTVEVDNTSAVDTVTINSLTDSVYGNLNGQGSCSVPQAIPPGGSYTCSFTQNLASTCPGSETDFVTASGTDSCDLPVSDEDEATVIITDVPSAVEIIKTANPDSHLEPGGPVTFSLVINNLSTADAVTITTLTDSIHGNLNGQGTCSVPQVIPSGGSYGCSFNANVSGNAGDVELDVATAAGTDECGNAVVDDDSATVTILDQPSSIDVVKTANPDSLPEPGGLVTFSVVINNTSLADTVTIASLIDSIYGNLNGQGTCSVPQIIPPGGSYSCSFTANVTSNCPTSETDIVTATGTDDDGDPVTDDDPATVTITDLPSSIGVIKTANPDTLPEPGGLVTFSVVINNTSAADVVTIASLTDTVYGNLNGQGTCSVPQVIPPGGFYVCTFTASVNGDGGTTHTNVATASGTDECANAVSDDDDAEVIITDIPSSIAVTKTASDNVLPGPGPVTFTVTVNNTSSVDTVTINSIVDSIYGNVANPLNPAITATSCAVPQVLPPSGSYQCSFTAILTETETDVVTVCGTDDDDMVVCDDDDETVQVPSCGDGVLCDTSPDCTTGPGGGPEECDDGNENSGDGCTPACALELPIDRPCDCACPSKVFFARTPNDYVYLKIGFEPTDQSLDPTAEDIHIQLYNVHGTVYQGLLPAGSLVQKTPRRFVYRDGTVPPPPGVTDGIRWLAVNIRQRDGVDYWRLQLKAYDLNLETTANESEMYLVITVGGDTFSSFACWKQVNTGWVVNMRYPLANCPP